jgi:hypothetical protein
MNAPVEGGLRLWRLMQRIEACRHRAEITEAYAASGPPAFRAEMARISVQWRMLADAVELLDATSPSPCFRSRAARKAPVAATRALA